MVKNIMSFGRSGLSDWVVQRVTAVIVAAFSIFLLGFIILNQPVDFVTWYELFAGLPMRIFTLLALISLLIHAWIGMWTIATDYVKPTWLRLLVELFIIFALAVFLFWGVYILFEA
jgi:succinate dehydrogenase / fumarate reductase membrane anchor subunit